MNAYARSLGRVYDTGMGSTGGVLDSSVASLENDEMNGDSGRQQKQ